MSPATTVKTNVPQDIQHYAAQIIRNAGLTVDEVVQGMMRQIAEQHSVPSALVRLTLEQESGVKSEQQRKANAASTETKSQIPNRTPHRLIAPNLEKRRAAIEAIKRLRKEVVIGPPITTAEIISARDEGRR